MENLLRNQITGATSMLSNDLIHKWLYKKSYVMHIYFLEISDIMFLMLQFDTGIVSRVIAFKIEGIV